MISDLFAKSFLEDYVSHSTTDVIEDGKEKEEIIAIAKNKMGIDLQDNFDLAGFKTIYTFTDVPNRNGARAPKELVLKALPTLIGKPVNINHNRQYVVGYYIDVRYVEKTKTVIAYGIFFKSNFGSEWKEAKQLLKEKKLGTSHEIWCPKDKKKKLADGTYEMQHIEFAGGALIYKNKPDPDMPNRLMDTSHVGCDVLETAKLHYTKSDVLDLFKNTKKYSLSDLIVASEAQAFLDRSIAEIQQKVDMRNQQQAQATQIETTTLPIVPKITCSNCNFTFETNEVGELKCPECKAIIDRTGKVLFPPQVFNFRFTDPIDRSSNWRLIEQSDFEATIKNIDSGRYYKIEFKKNEANDQLVDRLNLVYTGTAHCPQCGMGQDISAPSKTKIISLVCSRCGLKYEHSIVHAKQQQTILSYTDITEIIKNKDREGDKIVKKDLQVAKYIEMPEEKTCNLEIAKYINTKVDLEIAKLQTEEKVELELAKYTQDKILNLDISSLETKKEQEKLEEEKKEKSSKKMKKHVEKYKELKNKYKELKKEKSLEKSSLQNLELEIAKITTEANLKIDFYKQNANTLHSRRAELGEFAVELSDKDIMDDKTYELKKSERENLLLKAKLSSQDSSISDKIFEKRDRAEIQSLKKQIDKVAFRN